MYNRRHRRHTSELLPADDCQAIRTNCHYVRAHFQFQWKQSKDQEKKKCNVCMDKVLDVVFMPCRHMSTCNTCAEPLTKCPTCREHIEQCVKFFMYSTRYMRNSIRSRKSISILIFLNITTFSRINTIRCVLSKIAMFWKKLAP